jgi:hypothetical protein
MKRILLIVFYFCASFYANAQVKSFEVRADNQRIVIGEQFHLQLKVITSGKEKFPWIKIDSIHHFEIEETGVPDSLEQGQELVISQSITLTSWDSGEWQIPAFSFMGKTSQPVNIKVGFSPFDPKQDYHDIKDVFDVKKPARTLWYWYLLLLLLLITIIVLVFPTSKKDKPVKAIQREDPGAYKRALNDLKNLEQESGKMTAKIFFTELKDILRSYLAGRKNIDAFVLTNAMMMEAIRGYNLPSSLTEEARKTFEYGELAKFAKHEPSGNEMHESLVTIRSLIMEIENKS